MSGLTLGLQFQLPLLMKMLLFRSVAMIARRLMFVVLWLEPFEMQEMGFEQEVFA